MNNLYPYPPPPPPILIILGQHTPEPVSTNWTSKLCSALRSAQGTQRQRAALCGDSLTEVDCGGYAWGRNVRKMCGAREKWRHNEEEVR